MFDVQRIVHSKTCLQETCASKMFTSDSQKGLEDLIPGFREQDSNAMREQSEK